MDAKTPAYDVEAIRADFPILSREIHGKPLVYLDNGASAQKPRQVIDAVKAAYEHEYANVHRGLHFLSNAATDAYEAAREKVRRFLNARVVRQYRVHEERHRGDQHRRLWLGHAQYRRGRRDRRVDHGASRQHRAVALHPRAAGREAGLRTGFDDGALDIEAFTASLTERTKLVAITHMSNVLGTVVPIKEVCRIAHERGIPVLVDGSQGAVHMPVDVQDLDCDWYVFTGHKVYGPSGIGVLYGKAQRLEAMRPFQGGGEMIGEVTVDTITYNEPPHRFEAGTPPIVQAIGLGHALDYMDGIGREAIAAHEAELKATRMSSSAGSTRCASSATRRARAPSSPSRWKVSMRMTCRC
jgi:cysteine desulfurase/selenocysteine lyase